MAQPLPTAAVAVMSPIRAMPWPYQPMARRKFDRLPPERPGPAPARHSQVLLAQRIDVHVELRPTRLSCPQELVLGDQSASGESSKMEFTHPSTARDCCFRGRAVEILAGGAVVREEHVYFGPHRGGVQTFYFSKEETEKIAYGSKKAGVVVGVLASLIDSVTLGIVSAYAGAISRKAERCLRRGKFLKIDIWAVVVVPREYEP